MAVKDLGYTGRMEPRVLLRRPRAADREEFLALVRASQRHLRPWVAPPSTPEQFEAYLRRGRRADFQPLLACEREGGAIVGAFNLSQIFHGPFQNACLGYWAGAPFVGRGYMGEGLALVLAHAFGPLRLHRIEANVQPANLRSRALLERGGFRLEGFSPRYLKVAGRWRDHERWAVTREDWRHGGARQ